MCRSYKYKYITKPKFYILAKYDQIERDLIEDFVRAHQKRESDKKEMKKIASVLSHFKVLITQQIVTYHLLHH